MSGAVTEEVRALTRLDLEALRAEWRRRWGDPPGLRSPELLRHMMAWRIQVAALGDLDAETRRRLRRPAPSGQGRVRLTTGTQISREWHGVRHEVAVVEGGFVYEGATYRSLSKIAGVITGVKWNGPRFFGLGREGAA